MPSKTTFISENDLKRLIDKVIRDQIAVYENPVHDEEVSLLVEVAKTHDIFRRRRNEVFRLAELFDKQAQQKSGEISGLRRLGDY